MARWEKFAASGETIEMVEETWTLAAEMVCKALFDREMPFNPHFVFGQVKTYTDVMNHKSIRLKNVQRREGDHRRGCGQGDGGLGRDARDGDGSRHHRPSREDVAKMLEDAEADPDFPEFDRQQVIDEIKQYLWAGTETTALTLAWSLYLLSQHPEALERIRAEARAVCGERDPVWNEVQQLTYTRMVIQETMRLFPPIWALIRIAAGDDEIGGHKIKAGDKVVILAYVMHHSPKYWEEPEKFDPERFAPERAKKRVKYSYLPFSAGKRSCIGGALSQIENTLALVQLCGASRPNMSGRCRRRSTPPSRSAPRAACPSASTN